MWIYFIKTEPDNLVVGTATILITVLALVLYYMMWGRKIFEIDVGGTESKSKVSNQGNKHTFEISYVLKTVHPPVKIARVWLRFQNKKLQATEQDFELNSYSEAHISTFESYDDIQPWRRNENTYHLSILAIRTKPWESKEFKLNRSDMEFQVPTLAIGINKPLVQHEQSKSDKIDSQT